jgi:glycosyltransferase involved in cell wall biosynthesis
MKKLRILFIIPYPSEGASNRLRVEQYLPYLDREGMEYRLRPFVNKRFYSILYLSGHRLRKFLFFFVAILNRFCDLLRAFGSDIVFIHREALPVGSAVLEKTFSISGRAIVFDFDDAIFLPNTSPPNNYIERFKDPDKVSRIMRLSDCVIAGNAYLAEYARKFNKDVAIIPTPIDTERYAPADKGEDRCVTIGWIGSFTTRIYLEEVRPVLEALKRRYNGLRLKFVGNWAGLGDPIGGAEYKEWSLGEELADIRSFDIGIMPMPDDMWTKGKCGFKAILYMSCGIPVVSSPVGVNTEIIKNGENGFLAGSAVEWEGHLSRLIEDVGLRKRIGAAGRKTVERRYSVASQAARFIGVLRAVHDKRLSGGVIDV